MSAFQLITLPLLALMVVLSAVATARRRIAPRVGIAWTMLWLAASVAIAVPELLVKLARWMGIGRGADLVLYLAILFGFGAFFLVYLRFRRLDEQMTQIVRHLAIKDSLASEDEDKHTVETAARR